jgi:predicted CDP-diglyceride synthetase/phosphatidate cytidylyltransferase
MFKGRLNCATNLWIAAVQQKLPMPFYFLFLKWNAINLLLVKVLPFKLIQNQDALRGALLLTQKGIANFLWFMTFFCLTK